ncbi:MAG: SGNH/GDSL hydrolase family protein [Emcibacteraceae bacterium]
MLISCSAKNELIVDPSDPAIEYSGRINRSSEESVRLNWPGSSIRINFEGASIAALLQDESGDNYYNVILDNDSLFILRPQTIKQYQVLASNLSKGPHTIEIFRRTEWNNGLTNFYGFKINTNAKLLAKSPLKKRKIEFYGDSITAGFAVEDTSGKDLYDSIYTNNYASYAAITARHFEADYQCVCKSGIGVTVSWDPLIMPELYDRLIPTDSNSKWDFSLYRPDVVVVNLFQNDSWLVNIPEHPEFIKRFGDEKPDEFFIISAYQEFIAGLRTHYPAANIICTLGSMDATKDGSLWPGYVQKAVASLKDENVYTHFMPYEESSAHPNVQQQKNMANSLIEFIEKTIEW